MSLVNTLGRRSDFVRVFRKGKRTYGSILKMVGFRRSDSDGPRFAFQLRKQLGGAVVRNRIRRQLREIAAQLNDSIDGNWDIVVSVKPNAVGQRYHQLEKEFRQGLRHLGCLFP